MSFSEYLANPEIAARYKKIKPFFRLRQSGYDVTSRCQLRCDGCFYFQGDKSQLGDVEEPQRWRQFFIDEKKRGINHVNLAGAEPAIVPDILQVAWDVIPQGVVYSNGMRKIDPDIGFRIHLSVWGDAQGDLKYRGVNCLPKQLKNYKNDTRPVFVYTFNRFNIQQIDSVAEQIVDEGHQLTFNFFSNSVGSQSELSLNDEASSQVQKKIEECIDTYGRSVLFSHYGGRVHTAKESLYQKFGCPFPRVSPHKRGGVEQRYRNYRTNLSHEISSDCCVPDTDCNDCRHYAAGSAIISASMGKHVGSEKAFCDWLDYVDNYLATWVNGYNKETSLYVGV